MMTHTCDVLPSLALGHLGPLESWLPIQVYSNEWPPMERDKKPAPEDPWDQPTAHPYPFFPPLSSRPALLLPGRSLFPLMKPLTQNPCLRLCLEGTWPRILPTWTSLLESPRSTSISTNTKPNSQYLPLPTFPPPWMASSLAIQRGWWTQDPKGHLQQLPLSPTPSTTEYSCGGGLDASQIHSLPSHPSILAQDNIISHPHCCYSP